MGNTPPAIYMTQHSIQELLHTDSTYSSSSQQSRNKIPMSPKYPILIPPFKRQRRNDDTTSSSHLSTSHISTSSHLSNNVDIEPISAPVSGSPLDHLSPRATSEPIPVVTRSRSSSPMPSRSFSPRSSSPMPSLSFSPHSPHRSSSPLPRDPSETQLHIYALMKADPSMFGYAMIHSPREISPIPHHIPISTSTITSSLSSSTTSSFTTMTTSTSTPTSTSTSTSTPTPPYMDPSTEMSQRWDAWQQSLQKSEDDDDEDESEDDDSETRISPFVLSTSSPSSSSSPSPTSSFSSPSFPSTSHRRPTRTRPLTLRHQLHLDQINRKRKLQSDTTTWESEPISPACSDTSSCSSPSISISTSSPTPPLSVLAWSTDSPSSSSSLSSDLS